MSTAIKPEIYISWVPTGKINIKPEIYATWIPQGKIGLRPLIFATVIPAPEKASADLFRKVSNADTVQADLSRQLKNSEKNSADTLRNIVSTEIVTVDTKRKLFSEETAEADTFRRITQIGGVHADTFRLVKDSEQVVADTSRKIGITTSRADLQRIVKVTEKSLVDTQRKIGGSEKISADLYLKIVNGDTAEVDTFRLVKDSCTARADTLLKNGIREKNSADLQRAIANLEKTAADTFLQTASTEKVQGDLLRGLREYTRADTFRRVTHFEKTPADTVIRIPHIWKYIIQPPLLADSAETKQSIINTFKDYGVTAIDITLNERTLSDEFRFDITVPVEIEDSVEGQFLDYHFRFLVEETTLKDLVQSVKGMYNQDKLLYTQFFLPTVKIGKDDNEVEIVTLNQASDWVWKVASHLGLQANVLIEDFTPHNLSGDHRITYADLISSLFSWTTRLPQRQINVFIRGNTLHCIQRGKEGKSFDITNLPHSRPIINKKMIRSLWSNPKNENTNDNDSDNSNNPIVEYQYDEYVEPFSGTIHYTDTDCEVTLTYNTGLLVREHNLSENSKQTLESNIIYTYEEKFPGIDPIEVIVKKAFDKTFYGEFYLVEKHLHSTSENVDDDGEVTKHEQSGNTYYNYFKTDDQKDIYLGREVEETHNYEYTWGDKGGWELVDENTDLRLTNHVPIGNGWYGQSVYVNGKAQGANLSQGKPGQRVTQYTLAETQKNLSGWTVTYNNGTDEEEESGTDSYVNPERAYEDWRRKLAPIVDISFPVREEQLLYTLTEDLKWLNRKTQETVSVDLISKVVNGIPELQHIVDFTEKITLNGATYFLVSNNISFTPRKLIQKLQLIRWY